LIFKAEFSESFSHRILQNDKNRWVQETFDANIKKKRIEKYIGQSQEEIALNSG